MRTLTAVIADDERFMAEMLKRLLETYSDTQVIGMAYDGDEALMAVDRLKPDVVFLDIEMPGKTGLEVAALLDGSSHSPTVIFVTAYDDFALKAFTVNALDYILKPFDEADIKRVMKKVRKAYLKYGGAPLKEQADTSVKLRCHQKFCVAVNEEMIVIETADIQYIYAKDREVFIQTISGEVYPARQTLQDFEQKLDSMQFFRCHRNFIVNMNEVKQITPWFNRGYLLRLKGGRKVDIPVSRANVKGLELYMDF